MKSIANGVTAFMIQGIDLRGFWKGLRGIEVYTPKQGMFVDFA